MADADSSIILIATFISHQENIEWMIKKKLLMLEKWHSMLTNLKKNNFNMPRLHIRRTVRLRPLLIILYSVHSLTE